MMSAPQTFAPWLLRPLFAMAIVVAPSVSFARDWYQWRGPEQNGVSRETNLPEKWTLDGENVAWTAPVGGMSSPIVMKGRVYLLSRRGEAKTGGAAVVSPQTQETVVCLDANTGKPVWEHRMNMTQTEVPVHRLGWSSAVGDPSTGRVYALGTQCNLLCFDGESGKVLWQRQMTEEFGMISTFGGRTPSPAVDEDQVFIAGVAFGWGDNARSGYRVFAFDKKTGELNWTTATGGLPVDSPQQTPVITVIDGMRQLVVGSGDGGVYGFQARSGKKLWGHVVSKRGINAVPLVDGSRVYVCTGEVNIDNSFSGTVRCIDVAGGKPKELWRRDGIEAGFASPTIADGVLYVIDNKGKVHALDAMSGESQWKRPYSAGTIGKASLVFGDGKLYVAEANGRVAILKIEKGQPKPDVLSREEISGNAQESGREFMIFGSPAIANGRVFITSAEGTYCIGANDAKANDQPLPEMAKESADGDRKPAQVLVTPGDVVLHPGEKKQFNVKLYDAMGRAAETDKMLPQWSIGQLTLPPPPKPAAATQAAAAATAPAGPQKVGNLKGTVSADGTFTAEGGPHQGGGIFAKVGDVTGFARVRVLPPLPWTFDFSPTPTGAPPLTWLGAGGKFAVQELSSEKVLTKVPLVDLYYRARTNFGTPEMSNYTLQADVRSGMKEMGGQRHIPDPGVINQRYMMMLYGNHQRLQIHSWSGALATEQSNASGLQRTIPFKWEPDKWYTMKLRVEQADGKAIARGKVWPQGEKEPDAWTIELQDAMPNSSGNPGLFGHLLVTPYKSDINYDNVLVTPN
jgi:outer membrane protein assembly factor BamB